MRPCETIVALVGVAPSMSREGFGASLVASIWVNFAVLAAIILLLAFARNIRAGDRSAALGGRVPLSRRAKLHYSILFTIVIVGGLLMLAWSR